MFNIELVNKNAINRHFLNGYLGIYLNYLPSYIRYLYVYLIFIFREFESFQFKHLPKLGILHPFLSPSPFSPFPPSLPPYTPSYLSPPPDPPHRTPLLPPSPHPSPTPLYPPALCAPHLTRPPPPTHRFPPAMALLPVLPPSIRFSTPRDWPIELHDLYLSRHNH